MPVKLSEMEAVLREIRVKPMKSLGQNFLHDQNLAGWIVDQAKMTPDDYVVEIGPGLGALTEHALASGASVLAIEKDARLANFLREKLAHERLEILHADALDFDVRKLFAQRNVKLIGNLPYYASSEVLFKFTKYPSPICLWMLMLQKEVAERLSASPGTKEYGAMTLLIREHYHVENLRTVRASVFLPRPDVDSAIVRLTPRANNELPDHDSELFPDLVRRGFSQRRKQLQKLLRAECPNWSEAAASIGFDAKARAEQLSLEQWIALTNFVRPIVVPARIIVETERFQVVDKDDHALGCASRVKVHGDNLRHRAVHILIFNRDGEIYLQKRSRWKDRHAGQWDSSAAGHVNAGEQYDDAARRELLEELGVSAALERVLKLPASDRTGQEFIWLYRTCHDGPFQPARSEIETGEFFPPEIIAGWIEARPEDFAPGFLECWRAFQQDRH
ncbi:MAG: rRNA (adenine1518-N6/adenine1519-N6)-dimethyltransferase [Verrucomicrobiota bacterium]|jgi:16S rRNA (adenine1518-N6/adenine1519-N6)-dimethyltransferase